MASGIYTSAKLNFMKKVLDLINDTINVGLLTNSFTFTASNTIWSNVSANEISGVGYSTGGQALTSQAVSASGTTAVWTAGNVTWSGATFTAAFAVIYDTSVSNDLIAAIDFAGNVSVSSGTFEIQWSASPLTGSIISIA